jgi:hypothetical protein
MNASARPDEPGPLALANGIYLIDVPLQLPYGHTLLEFVMAFERISAPTSGLISTFDSYLRDEN